MELWACGAFLCLFLAVLGRFLDLALLFITRARFKRLWGVSGGLLRRSAHVWIRLAHVNAEFLKKIIFYSIGPRAPFCLCRIVIPRDRMSLGRVCVVLVVCVGPLDRQIRLIQKHSPAALHVHGLNAGIFFFHNVEVYAELVHRRSNSPPHVVNFGEFIGNLLAVLFFFNPGDLAPQLDKFLLQAHYLDRLIPSCLEWGNRGAGRRVFLFVVCHVSSSPRRTRRRDFINYLIMKQTGTQSS